MSQSEWGEDLNPTLWFGVSLGRGPFGEQNLSSALGIYCFRGLKRHNNGCQEALV